MSDFSQQLTQDFIYTLAFTASQTHRKVLYAARQSGLYLSEDEGKTWQSAYASLNLDAPLPTTCLALAPQDAPKNYLFAGVPGHVMRTEDGGQEWIAIPLPHTSAIPTALAISASFAQDGVLLLGTNEDGVLRSADQGRSWASWNFGLLDFNVLCLAISPAFEQDETVFAGTGSGLFVSQTGGRAWKELNLPAGYVPILSLGISPNFENDGTLLAGTESEGLWITQNRGASWQRLGEQAIPRMVNQIILDPASRTTLIVQHENTVQRSTDMGKTWSVLYKGEVACLAAFQDETDQHCLLAGLLDGTIQKI